MKSRTVIVSLIVHVGLATALLFAAERKEKRRATAITMADEVKKEKPKPPPPPKPIVEKPKPPKAPPRVVAEPAKPVSAPEPARPTGPAPVNSGLTLGDPDGSGMDVGGPATGRQPGTAPVKATKNAETGPVKKTNTPAPKKKDEQAEEECQEDATRPEALSEFDVDAARQAAQRANLEGKIRLRITVDKNGGVSKVEVVKGIDAQLDATLVALAEKMRFKPAMKCGKPIAGGTFNFASTIELTD